MPSAKITAMQFREEDFPLSPYVLGYEILEDANQVLVRATCLKGKFNERRVDFLDVEQPQVVGAPDGTYTIDISVQGDEADPFIVFDLRRNTTGCSEGEARLHYARFVDQFLDAAQSVPPSQIHDFEVAWSTAYMISFFEGLIDGSEVFWERFYGDLDVAFLPVTLKMNRAREWRVSKPIHIELAQEIDMH